MALKKWKKIFQSNSKYIFFSKPSFGRSLLTATRVFWEFLTGFLFIAQYKRAVSFFGSARETMPTMYYDEAEELAARLSRRGFTIITGGSGGIMRAANKGAWKVNGQSVGVTIDLPMERGKNIFLTSSKRFRYFFSRKTVLSCAAEIYVFFPGGFGTFDELFEMLTMLQTGHSERVPIFLYGADFWKPLYEYIEKTLYTNFKTISRSDLNLVQIVDSVDELEGVIEGLENDLPDRVCYAGLVRTEPE